jgi:hypothetical protein
MKDVNSRISGLIKRLLKKNRKVLSPGFFYFLSQRVLRNYTGIAQIVQEMAETGRGTDVCLEYHCLPMQVHFYSPVPDIKDLSARKVWNRRTQLPGIDFQVEKQLDLLKKLGLQYGRECKWPLKPTGNPANFHTDNGCFSYGCAASLHTMIRSLRPRQLIEIGSGFSSRVISGAIKCNTDEGNPCHYCIVDPYPGEVITSGCLSQDRLVQERVELLKAEAFDVLAENDILFIDSGHTVRTGSDVNFLFLDILPRLKPGVVVHIHDISLPYEYPEVYFTNPGFRVFWTEAYLLQAFLSFNSAFEVMLAMNFIQTEHMNTFCEAFPCFNLQENWANSGSFWIRRKVHS